MTAKTPSANKVASKLHQSGHAPSTQPILVLCLRRFLPVGHSREALAEMHQHRQGKGSGIDGCLTNYCPSKRPSLWPTVRRSIVLYHVLPLPSSIPALEGSPPDHTVYPSNLLRAPPPLVSVCLILRLGRSIERRRHDSGDM